MALSDHTIDVESTIDENKPTNIISIDIDIDDYFTMLLNMSDVQWPAVIEISD